jgi:hypothetical protein
VKCSDESEDEPYGNIGEEHVPSKDDETSDDEICQEVSFCTFYYFSGTA